MIRDTGWTSRSSRTCLNCDAEIEKGFSVCWKCGTSIKGVADPNFVAEVDAAALPTEWVPRIHCKSCGYKGKVLVGHSGYDWWMLPLAVTLPCTLIGVIPWLVFFVVMANLRYKACPSCDSRSDFVEEEGIGHEPKPEAEEIWREKQEADDLAFKSDTRALLAVAVVVFSVSLLMAIVVAM